MLKAHIEVIELSAGQGGSSLSGAPWGPGAKPPEIFGDSLMPIWLISLEEQLMNFDKIWVDLFLDVSDSGFESVDSDEELWVILLWSVNRTRDTREHIQKQFDVLKYELALHIELTVGTAKLLLDRISTIIVNL